MSKSAIVLFLCAALPIGLLGQTIELKSGEIYIGRVIALDDKEMKVEVGFPDRSTVTVRRVDVTPLSLYAVLAARSDLNSAAAHLALAAACHDLDLPAHAIAEYREAARLDPATKATADERIGQIRREIAAEFLSDAKEAFAENRIPAARLAAQSVVDKFPDTPAAAEAARVLEQIVAQERATGGKPQRKLPAKDVEAALRTVGSHMKDAALVPPPASRGTTKDQRRWEAIIDHLEAAWRAIKDLAPPDDDAAVANQLSQTQKNVRSELVDAYLAIGLVFVQRRATQDADAYCEKASELDPDSKMNHHLHDLIIQAKISNGWNRGQTGAR